MGYPLSLPDIDGPKVIRLYICDLHADTQAKFIQGRAATHHDKEAITDYSLSSPVIRASK